MYKNYQKGKESFKLKNRCLSFLILLTFSSQADFTSAENVTVAKFEISDLSENRSHQGVIYIAKQKLRIDTEPDSSINTSIIFRGDQQHMIVLDHSQKTYFIIDENYMLQVGKKLNEALAQMEAYLDQLPEKQKEMARRMMTEQILMLRLDLRHRDLHHRDLHHHLLNLEWYWKLPLQRGDYQLLNYQSN